MIYDICLNGAALGSKPRSSRICNAETPASPRPKHLHTQNINGMRNDQHSQFPNLYVLYDYSRCTCVCVCVYCTVYTIYIYIYDIYIYIYIYVWTYDVHIYPAPNQTPQSTLKRRQIGVWVIHQASNDGRRLSNASRMPHGWSLCKWHLRPEA